MKSTQPVRNPETPDNAVLADLAEFRKHVEALHESVYESRGLIIVGPRPYMEGLSFNPLTGGFGETEADRKYWENHNLTRKEALRTGKTLVERLIGREIDASPLIRYLGRLRSDERYEELWPEVRDLLDYAAIALKTVPLNGNPGVDTAPSDNKGFWTVADLEAIPKTLDWSIVFLGMDAQKGGSKDAVESMAVFG